jgi:alkanesulfonate monooxygenase SsuD/methylene tetrahydromethanopterin reductase-like flavin-dependent oxidoreductase (luciferase family)
VSLIHGARVGIQLPEVEREVRWPEYQTMAQAAEKVGFGPLGIGSHLIYRGDGPPKLISSEDWTLCSGERCTFAGTFNTVNDSVFLPRAHPPIPIMIDPINERSVRSLAEALR